MGEYTGAELLPHPGTAWLNGPREEWQQGPAPSHPRGGLEASGLGVLEASGLGALEASELGALGAADLEPSAGGPSPCAAPDILQAWPPDDGGSLGPRHSPPGAGHEDELLGESFVESGNGSALLSKAARGRAAHSPTLVNRAATPAPRNSVPFPTAPCPAALGYASCRGNTLEGPAPSLGVCRNASYKVLPVGSAPAGQLLMSLHQGLDSPVHAETASTTSARSSRQMGHCRSHSVLGDEPATELMATAVHMLLSPMAMAVVQQGPPLNALLFQGPSRNAPPAMC